MQKLDLDQLEAVKHLVNNARFFDAALIERDYLNVIQHGAGLLENQERVGVEVRTPAFIKLSIKEATDHVQAVLNLTKNF